MEATYLGCVPLGPNNLVYPELYKGSGIFYKDEDDLYCKLSTLINCPSKLREGLVKMNFDPFDWEKLKLHYLPDLLHVKNSE
jgi:hypothetical protein